MTGNTPRVRCGHCGAKKVDVDNHPCFQDPTDDEDPEGAGAPVPVPDGGEQLTNTTHTTTMSAQNPAELDIAKRIAQKIDHLDESFPDHHGAPAGKVIQEVTEDTAIPLKTTLDVVRRMLDAGDAYEPVQGRTSFIGPDPSLVTDGGFDVEAHLASEPWCDWCQTNIADQDTIYLSTGPAVTGIFCSRDCAHTWSQDKHDVEEHRRRELAADGGITWSDLHAFKRDCLRAIRALDVDDETTYGLEIKRKLEEWMGEEVNHGRLYPNLDDLVRKGLVEKGELDKRTNKYELTPAGAELVASQVRADVERLDVHVQNPPAARADGSGNGGE